MLTLENKEDSEAPVLVNALGLVKDFGKLRAVDDLSFKVAAGEIYGLVGPDGAGKTTTFRLLCGALRLNGGEVTIAGHDLAHEPEVCRSYIGYLAQRFALYPELTVLENIRFFAEVRGITAKEWRPRCLELLKFVDLQDFADRLAGKLSGGMKQKLGLASALIHRPALLLLDEPTTGVDPVTRQDFWQLIIKLVRSEGLGVVVSTPYMDEAGRCMHLGLMRQGRILSEGTPHELCRRLDERMIELIGAPLPLWRELVSLDQDVEDVQVFGVRLHIRVKSGCLSVVCTRLLEQKTLHPDLQLETLTPVSAQLEDVLISLIQEGQMGQEVLQ